MGDDFEDIIALGAEARDVVQAIKPLLAGHRPEAQGAALADLLSIWLAGHVIVGDPKATKDLRASMLKAHIKAVKTLIPFNHEGLIAPELKRRAN